MTYVQGGLIEAQDYNNLLGGNATSNSNTLEYGHGVMVAEAMDRLRLLMLLYQEL